MVSVLALNKLELRDMITAEMVENPVLEELEDAVPLLDDVNRREEDGERPAIAAETPITPEEKKDPFEEIDFGSFFQEYLDPGYRSQGEMEEIERPSFENFLSKPSNLSDHLAWQLGALPVRPEVRQAAELIIGNLNEDGYLIASDEELLGIAPPAPPEVDATVTENVVKDAVALGIATEAEEAVIPEESGWSEAAAPEPGLEIAETSAAVAPALEPEPPPAPSPVPEVKAVPHPVFKAEFSPDDLKEAIELVRQMDPPGVACRDLRECLLYQLRYHQHHLAAKANGHKESAVKENGKESGSKENGNGEATARVLSDAVAIVDQHLRALQNKQHKEIARAIGRPIEAVQQALEYIRTLDPRPGQQYNKVQPRLIEPDVAFVKHGDEWLCLMNDDDVPQLRLNPAYKRLLTRDTNDKDTRNYVKERYKSAIQLIKNIEQRKQTIMKVCYSIVDRQRDFLEKGIDQLKPMMIKEVAEEIGVHPSTVSRAVANKYAHTPQGVFELRYFFSESVNGPQGGNTSLLILKRRVKKLIEEEDPSRPLTDEQITRILQSQGIQVTRRTVAKYREDMRIPSTHQRRVKK